MCTCYRRNNSRIFHRSSGLISINHATIARVTTYYGSLSSITKSPTLQANSWSNVGLSNGECARLSTRISLQTCQSNCRCTSIDIVGIFKRVVRSIDSRTIQCQCYIRFPLTAIIDIASRIDSQTTSRDIRTLLEVCNNLHIVGILWHSKRISCHTTGICCRTNSSHRNIVIHTGLTTSTTGSLCTTTSYYTLGSDIRYRDIVTISRRNGQRTSTIADKLFHRTGATISSSVQFLNDGHCTCCPHCCCCHHQQHHHH